MFKPETPEDRQYEQAMIDSIYARFVGHVKAGRKGKLKGKITEICDARAFTAQQALDYGLIDEIGFAEDAYAKAAKLASLQKPHIVKFQRRPSFFDLMGQDNQPPPSSRGNGGVNLSLHIDERAIEFFSGPKLMVLWQGQ
jgi:protease-4